MQLIAKRRQICGNNKSTVALRFPEGTPDEVPSSLPMSALVLRTGPMYSNSHSSYREFLHVSYKVLSHNELFPLH